MRPRVLVLAVLVLLFAGPSGPLLAGEADLRSRLHETNLNMSVDDQAFVEVVALLRAQTGINVVIDPRIQEDAAATTIVSLQAKEMRLTQVLDLLATSAGEEMAWVVRGNTILFTYHEFALSPMEVRLYPVAALTAGRTSFVPASDLLRDTEEVESIERACPLGRIDEFMELIRGAVAPSFWDEREGANMRAPDDHVLVVRAEPRIHQKIHEFLTRLEDMEPQAVTVEIRAVAAEQLPDGLDAGAAALTDAQAQALLSVSPDGPALSLAVRADLPSTAFVGSRRAYVAGYDAAFAGEESLSDPRVDSIELGMAVRVRALPAKPKGRILLQLDAAVAGSAPAGEIHGADSGQAILLPASNVVRRDATLLVAPGRWHLTEGRLGGADAGRWAFLVRATPAPVKRASAPALTALAVPDVVPSAGARLLSDKMIKGLRWDAADLDHVLSYLRTVSGLNFFLTSRVRDEVFEDVVVNMDLDDVALSTVLDMVTEPYGLEWSAAENLVTIDVRNVAHRKMELRYFDVKDLTEPLQMHQVRSSSDPWQEEEEEEPVALLLPDQLVELLRETIGTYDEWEDPASIEARNRILIVRQTPAILHAVETFLTELRASRSVVGLTVEYLEVEAAAADRILGSDGAGAAPFLLADETVRALHAAVASGDATRLSRERIVSVERAGAPRKSGHEISFVADYDIEGSGKARAPVARVDTLLAGNRIDLRAIRGYAGDRAHLEIRFERSMLASKSKADTPHGAIDLPTTDVWSVATGLSVPYETTAVVCASRAKGVWRLLLATPYYVSLAE